MLVSEKFNEFLVQDQYYFENGRGGELMVALPEINHVQDISEIVKLLMAVVQGSAFIDEVAYGRQARLTKMGRQLLSALRIDVEYLQGIYAGGRLSPYLQVFQKVKNQLQEEDKGESFTGDSISSSKEVDVVRKAIIGIRQETASGEFKSHWRNCQRAVAKNAKGLERFIDSLFIRNSRMLVIRLDLGYSLAYLQSQGIIMSLDRVKKDFSVFLRFLRRGRLKESLYGYVWKLEFGPTKQYHYHLMIFLDGSKHQEDVSLCEEIGEIWSKRVTNGEGCYFNCNRKKEMYGRRGIGMVSWNDVAMIENLKWAGKYLVKKDLLIRPNLSDKERMFGKSFVSTEGRKMGRPRKATA
ncbi:inovirus Gp2 family protein [Pseudomonas stutzeri]|uniref:YagK/YfjJ domain-containing protein n=1 Tax=Stutzerimonas stutzeri TaxID=316 RepID=UPI00210CB219|nr:inovirus-type Gp2 protein [Stutzerimonas stutzeri]MCQ4311059.1 inovirus Gp2 family protein [Stutzerimonas stutzeri]